ncbi:hypothetical protein CLOBOL_03004 [Enterocloster bolteae ATCC BAA-613]|uniref:Uncharacterized protein n=1 Tax=Enterocloster bolteae (strain ATCC BAA-613 / DSM 15670 / CCUG 46953 / JCM 12243 / WAL 16351) TaxID=411902 RepID=A8RRH8_ENTBW|nr:hypothetical protein CLOBOL_03004 [Enterocloster bolteae ATCC BAA-613]
MGLLYPKSKSISTTSDYEKIIKFYKNTAVQNLSALLCPFTL